jgi:hypothetical protein
MARRRLLSVKAPAARWAAHRTRLLKTIKLRERGIGRQMRLPDLPDEQSSTCAARSPRIRGYGVPPTPSFFSANGSEKATYIHELKGWPRFRWDRTGLAELVAAVRHRQGRSIGRMEGLGLKLRTEATLRSLTEEVVKSSEIEGEILDRDQARSSLARRLAVEIGAPIPADHHVEGVVEKMFDATENYNDPLTAERLFGWHAAQVFDPPERHAKDSHWHMAHRAIGTHASCIRPDRTRAGAL